MKLGMDNPNKLIIWKAMDEFTIHDATLLMFGIAPEGRNCELLRGKPESNWPENMLAIVRLLTAKLENEELKGRRICYEDTFEPVTDIFSSTVEPKSLQKLLRDKGIRDNFFNDEDSTDVQASYLNPTHESYAPKLAAAIAAWTEVSAKFADGSATGTPKQQIEAWLRKNASKYGLLNEETGKHVEYAIEQISVIANWRPEGGASKTPTKKKKSPVKTESPQEKKAAQNTITLKNLEPLHPTRSDGSASAFDDDIPF